MRGLGKHLQVGDAMLSGILSSNLQL